MIVNINSLALIQIGLAKLRSTSRSIKSIKVPQSFLVVLMACLHALLIKTKIYILIHTRKMCKISIIDLYYEKFLFQYKFSHQVVTNNAFPLASNLAYRMYSDFGEKT